MKGYRNGKLFHMDTTGFLASEARDEITASELSGHLGNATCRTRRRSEEQAARLVSLKRHDARYLLGTQKRNISQTTCVSSSAKGGNLSMMH